MKILHIITSLKIGGAELALYNFLKVMSSDQTQEHRVAYFYYGPLVEQIDALGIKLYCIPGFIIGYDPIGWMQLSTLIRNYKPDILHASLWTANLVARLLGARFKIPVITEIHSNPAYDGRLRLWGERLTAPASTVIVPVGKSLEKQYKKQVIEKGWKDAEMLKTKVLTVQNGIDVQAFRQKILDNSLKRAELGFKKDDIIFGSVGRLEPIKGYDLLLHAFKMLMDHIAVQQQKRIKLLIVGGGSQQSFLQKQITLFGLDHAVTLTGMRSDAHRFYNLFDCFVISSRSEGLSLALLEAAAAGLPLISTHYENEHDIINHGVNGFIVNNYTPETLKEALLMMLAIINTNQVQFMKDANERRAFQDFDIKRVAYEKFVLYQHLLKNIKN